MKFIAYFIFIYFLSIIQFSFLPAYLPFLPVLNLLMIFTILFTAFENPNEDGAFFIGFICGMINDFLSPHFLGLYIMIFFVVVYFVKFILKHYVQPSFTRRI